MVYKPNTLTTTVATKGSKLLSVRVLDIILDINHPYAEEYGGHDAIGTISFTYLDDNLPLKKAWLGGNTAGPLFSNIKNYPLKNEIVIII